MDQLFQLPSYTYLGGEATQLTLRETIKRLEVSLQFVENPVMKRL